MRIESAQAALSASLGWLAAIGGAEQISTQQITGSMQLGVWLLLGAVCGAGTAVLFPAPTDYPVWRRWAAAFLAAIGGTVAAFAWFGLERTTDTVFAVAWIAGGMAWVAVPVLKRGGLQRIRNFIGGKPNE